VRASDLIDATVVDVDGGALGTVSDVRLARTGPPRGAWGPTLRIAALIVSDHRLGGFLGYDRGKVHGPWLVATLVRWLHRDAVLVPWADVVSHQHGRIVVRTPKSRQPRLWETRRR
jgi:sporulation protein YlmC with PRC-barrel domain